jgi:hypothetical protein
LGCEQPGADLTELAERVLGERVDHELADRSDVSGGGRCDLVPARVGEHGVDEAAVAWTRLAAHPAFSL